MNNNNNNNIEKVSAELSMDSLRILFNSIVGRPDSKTKLFYDPVEIKPTDLVELNKRISEKLATHDIFDVVTQVDVFYGNNEIDQYGYWDTFESKNWKSSKLTKGLNVKWEFMVKIAKYPVPQRHTLSVKIKPELPPLEVFRYLLSEDPGDMERLETENAPIICRVDYLNEVLAEELVFVVEKWVDALIKPSYNLPLYRFVKKYGDFIKTFVHFSIPLSYAAILGGRLTEKTIQNYGADNLISVGIFSNIIFWLLIFVVLLVITFQIGEAFSKQIAISIKEYGKHTPINFTNGDQNKINKTLQENKHSIATIISNFLIALTFDIISAYVTFLVLK